MALEYYVEQADRAPLSGVANEEIYAGELVHDDGDGVDVLTYAATDEDVSGHVGLARYDAEAMAAEWEEDVVEENYASGERVQYQEFESDARVKIRTPNDNSTDPAPSISHLDVVGVLDDTVVSGSGGEYQGRVVEEGYADATPTTFDRGAGNFKAVGVAYRPGQRANDTVTSYDHPVRVRLFGDFKENA